MKIATDVHYTDTDATCAIVAFREWTDAKPAWVYVHRQEGPPAAYEPGSLWKRELPPLRAALAALDVEPELVIVDSYVMLGTGPGFGAILHREFDQGERRNVPVIGVAKTRFRTAVAEEVRRGTSDRPLFVSAVGISHEAAAAAILSMYGPDRLPTLLRLADHLSRCFGLMDAQ